jgi:hypothetical protein
MSSALARLVHDVGKHGSRAARNLPNGPVPSVLVDMLLVDLYGRDGEPRVSARFDALAPPVGEDATLDRVRGLLSEIDALEAGVRDADEGAIRRAAELALAVDAALRDAARERAP